MPVVNTSSRKHRFIVSGLDVSDLVEHFETGDDRIESSSGLIATRGTLKLRYNPNFNAGRDPKISFDPKTPSSSMYWARGQLVNSWINNTSGDQDKHPRHSLRILKATYDREELSLTLDLGCLLALLDAPQPEGDGSNTCVNQVRSVDSVIRDLVSSAGSTYPEITPIYIGVIPGFISSPQEKGSGGSYISQAAKIAADKGYALWVTKDEQIKAIRIIPDNSNARFVLEVDRNVAQYQVNAGDSESSESPYNSIRVRYTLVTIKETEQSYTSHSESYGILPSGGDGLVETVVITDTLSSNTRSVITITQRPRGVVWPWVYTDDELASGNGNSLVLDTEVIELYTYEDDGGWDNEEDEACPKDGLSEESSQGRLLRYQKQVIEEANKAITEWASFHETLGFIIYPDPNDRSKETRVFGEVLVDEEVREYSFFKSEEQIEEGEENVKKIVTTYKKNRAYIFPKAWAYRFGGLSGDTPTGVVYAGREEVTWRRRLGTQEWEKRTTKTAPIGIANKSIVEARLKRVLERNYQAETVLFLSDGSSDRLRRNAIDNVRLFAERTIPTLNKVEVSVTQVNPPSPEFIPNRYSREEEEIEEKINFSTPYSVPGQDRSKEIRLDTTVERRLTKGELLVAINPLTSSGAGLKGAGSEIEQVIAAARVEAFLTWGRFRAIDCTYELKDLWFDLPQLPLVPFDVIDTDRITGETLRHAYLTDGWSSALTQTELLCSHSGLWLGSKSAIRRETITIVTELSPGDEAVEVERLAYAFSEGDPILVEELAILQFSGSPIGVLSLGLAVPTTVEIPAGTSIMVGGTVVLVSSVVAIGSTSIPIAEPLTAPIIPATTGVAGTVVIVTTYTPIGSTAIPIKPAALAVPIPPGAVTIEVPTIELTTSLPIDAGVDLILTATSVVSPTLEPVVSDVTITLEAPSNNSLNIGVVIPDSDILLDNAVDITELIISDTDTLLYLDVFISISSEVTTIIEADAEVTLSVLVDTTLLIVSEVGVFEVVLSSSEVVLDPDSTVIETVISDSIVIAVAEAVTDLTLVSDSETIITASAVTFEVIEGGATVTLSIDADVESIVLAESMIILETAVSFQEESIVDIVLSADAELLPIISSTSAILMEVEGTLIAIVEADTEIIIEAESEAESSSNTFYLIAIW